MKVKYAFRLLPFLFFLTYKLFKKMVYIRIWLILIVAINLKKIHPPEAEILPHEVGNMEKVTFDC